MAFSVWPLWAGRLDWNQQDDTLLRKQYVIRVNSQSQAKSSTAVCQIRTRSLTT